MKSLKWLLLLFAILGAFISSCSSNTPVVSPTGVNLTAKTTAAALASTPEILSATSLTTPARGVSQVLLYEEWPQAGFPDDAAQITTVTLEKNILKIQVVYQGGCQDHTFELYAATAFLQSLPPQGILHLSHDSHGDPCAEHVEKLLAFDLTPLNEERNDPSEHPLLLRIHEPVGSAFANEPYMPLIEWP